MEFGEVLREYRERRNWSIRALAARAELDPGYISRVERGSYRAPRPVTIERLIAALELNVDEAELMRQASGRPRGGKLQATYDRASIDLAENLAQRMLAVEDELRGVKEQIARLESANRSRSEESS